MKIEKALLTKLEADEGKILVDKEGYGAKLIYLGIYDSPDNYIEIDEAEYVEPEIPGQES